MSPKKLILLFLTFCFAITFAVTANAAKSDKPKHVKYSGLKDTDGDGVPDVRDEDDDGDGISDAWEEFYEERENLDPEDEDDSQIIQLQEYLKQFQDLNTIAEQLNTTAESLLDELNEALNELLDDESAYEYSADQDKNDNDGDGLVDAKDLDDDNDGILDADDPDANGNGMRDAFEHLNRRLLKLKHAIQQKTDRIWS